MQPVAHAGRRRHQPTAGRRVEAPPGHRLLEAARVQQEAVQDRAAELGQRDPDVAVDELRAAAAQQAGAGLVDVDDGPVAVEHRDPGRQGVQRLLEQTGIQTGVDRRGGDCITHGVSRHGPAAPPLWMPQGQYARAPPVKPRREGRSRQTGPVSPETMLLLVLGAIAVIVAVRWVADRTGLPAAALLTVVGITYALLPGPNIDAGPGPGPHPGAARRCSTARRWTPPSGDPPQPAHGGQPLGPAGPGDRAGHRHRVRAVRRRGDPGRRDRARRRGRAAGPGGGAGGGPQGRAAAAADHHRAGRGPAQRRHRADDPVRGGRRRAGRRFSTWRRSVSSCCPPRAGWLPASRSPTASVRCAGCGADPLSSNAISLPRRSSPTCWRSRCTCPACSPSSSPG